MIGTLIGAVGLVERFPEAAAIMIVLAALAWLDAGLGCSANRTAETSSRRQRELS